MTPSSERTTVSLPRDLYLRLRTEARAEKRSVSSLVGEALQAYFAAQGSPPLPEFIGVGEGPGDDVSERIDEIVGEAIDERHRRRAHGS